MTQQQNPLRIIADTQFGVRGGSSNLVANGIYSVDDIITPILTQVGIGGDPRVFVATGSRTSRLRWRQVNGDGWISPKHKQAGDSDTVIQIRYARPRKLNFLSFELLRVPQTWKVKYYDSVRKRMVVLADDRGNDVSGDLVGFKSNVLQPRHERNNSHKWGSYEYDLPTIRTNLIEIHLNRDVRNSPGLDFFGLPRDTPYSLGIRNLKVKLKIRDDGDNDDDDDGTPTPIGTTERPVVTRHTSVNAHDGDPTSYWECAPQGAANSVVPFYVDVRGDDGSAAIFDRLKMVPLWAGPSMSVYWSNDDVATPWELSPNRSEFSRIGDAAFARGVGASSSAAGQGWSISNDYMKVDLSSSFMVGLLFTPTDTNAGGTGDGGNRYLWTFERPAAGLALSLRFNPTAVAAGSMSGTFEVAKLAGGVTTVLFTSSSYTLTKSSQYGVVLGYNTDGLDPTSSQGWHLAVAAQPASDANIVVESSQTNLLTPFYPTAFVLGSNQSAALDRPMLGVASRAWVRMDTFSEGAARSFLKGPQPFSEGSGDHTQRVNGFYDAVLIANLTIDTKAQVGPGAGYYRNKEWMPVPIDYGLQSSQYQLPLLNAKFLKLEFTQLIPRVYLTEVPQLPVYAFPKWVTDWYRSTVQSGQPGPYTLANSRELFESVPALPTPGDGRRLADVREALDGRGGSGVPSMIFHTDQSSADYSTNPSSFDGSAAYQELAFATTTMRFFRTSRHEYETRFVPTEQRAFFVGIKELQVFRSDHTVQFDTREYAETYDDSAYFSSSTGWINVGGVMQAQSAGAVLRSKAFPSFSKFSTVQAAVLDSSWESAMSQAQIDLGTVTHLVDPQGASLDSSTSTLRTFVTGQYQGARGGNVIQLARAGVGSYGVKTGLGLLTSNAGAITSGNPRTSAVVRLQLPQTNAGTYELHLYAFNGGVTQQRRLVASKQIHIPVKSWQEVELAYVANTDDFDWQAEVVQVDPSVSEPLIVDMLGIWQNPVKWEFSNDGGVTYQVALWPLNKPTGYLRFKAADSRLVVRTTALKAGASISGWTIIPWYIESSMVMRAPIDYSPPWGVSDQEDLLDTSRKPIFQTWSRFFPQRFSVNLYGFF